jgi:hypothetical protein
MRRSSPSRPTKSLKSLFDEIGPVLGMTPMTLHMRQLAYMRWGLLPAKAGRGPGSGVPGTPDALAEFLIALVTDATVAENVPAAYALAGANPPDISGVRKTSPTFKDELTRILSDVSLAAQVEGIHFLASGHAVISAKLGIKVGGVGIKTGGVGNAFVGGPAQTGGFQVERKITGDAVHAMAQVLARSPWATEEPFDRESVIRAAIRKRRT